MFARNSSSFLSVLFVSVVCLFTFSVRHIRMKSSVRCFSCFKIKLHTLISISLIFFVRIKCTLHRMHIYVVYFYSPFSLERCVVTVDKTLTDTNAIDRFHFYQQVTIIDQRQPQNAVIFFFHLIICIWLFVMIAMKYKIDSNHLLFHLHFQFMKIACANKSTNIPNVCLSRLLYFIRLRRFSSYFMPLIISGNDRVKWQHGINQQMKPTILFSPHARE